MVWGAAKAATKCSSQSPNFILTSILISSKKYLNMLKIINYTQEKMYAFTDNPGTCSDGRW